VEEKIGGVRSIEDEWTKEVLIWAFYVFVPCFTHEILFGFLMISLYSEEPSSK